MKKNSEKNWGNAPIVVLLGVIASLIAIFAFITGKQNVPEIMATPTANPSPISNLSPVDLSAPPFSSIASDSNRDVFFQSQVMTSPNGKHTLKLIDGNLILYSNEKAVWSTNTQGSKADHLVMQNDGNLVLLYAQTPIWSSQTQSAAPASGYSFTIQDDGNLVIYSSESKVVWSMK